MLNCLVELGLISLLRMKPWKSSCIQVHMHKKRFDGPSPRKCYSRVYSGFSGCLLCLLSSQPLSLPQCSWLHMALKHGCVRRNSTFRLLAFSLRLLVRSCGNFVHLTILLSCFYICSACIVFDPDIRLGCFDRLFS